jgi:hypothetical protein
MAAGHTNTPCSKNKDNWYLRGGGTAGYSKLLRSSISRSIGKSIGKSMAAGHMHITTPCSDHKNNWYSRGGGAAGYSQLLQ